MRKRTISNIAKQFYSLIHGTKCQPTCECSETMPGPVSKFINGCG